VQDIKCHRERLQEEALDNLQKKLDTELAEVHTNIEEDFNFRKELFLI